MQKRLLAAAAAVLFLAGCGGPKPEVPQNPGAKKPDTSNVKIDGDADAPVNKLAIEAIADLQDFWGKEFPKLYNEDYKPVKGGFFASTPESESGPECAKGYGDVEGNAFYCKLDDSVAWDAAELLPELRDKFGDFVIPVVLAHEWGHAMQQRSGFFDQNTLTVSSELQADCFAGAWSKHAKDDGVFEVTGLALDNALAGILSLRDHPGADVEGPSAHGSGFDRVSAFQDGYDNSVEKCKEYKDGEPAVFELPFTSEEAAATEGNAPYDTIVAGVPTDLEDYWTLAFPQVSGGKPWVPLAAGQPFDPSSPPACGGTPVDSSSLFYCIPDDYVGWDNVEEMRRFYDRGGDWAVATLLATQWGLAAQHQLGDDLSDVKTTTARGDCLAGAYTQSVAVQDRADTSHILGISPGDLDEGIMALLQFRADGDIDRQGAGFDRTRAFREGFFSGPDGCMRYQA